jgi:hypothetical protein
MQDAMTRLIQEGCVVVITPSLQRPTHAVVAVFYRGVDVEHAFIPFKYFESTLRRAILRLHVSEGGYTSCVSS